LATFRYSTVHILNIDIDSSEDNDPTIRLPSTKLFERLGPYKVYVQHRNGQISAEIDVGSADDATLHSDKILGKDNLIVCQRAPILVGLIVDGHTEYSRTFYLARPVSSNLLRTVANMYLLEQGHLASNLRYKAASGSYALSTTATTASATSWTKIDAASDETQLPEQNYWIHASLAPTSTSP
jgi:hypothetical protein